MLVKVYKSIVFMADIANAMLYQDQLVNLLYMVCMQFIAIQNGILCRFRFS